jgi:branched-chain amino acid transport system permease protein
MNVRSLRQNWIWIAALAIAMAAPWAFYNYHTGRQSGFVVSMLSQMGMMSILALSYNMLLGQAGLFSFGHAVFFGIGGYATIHVLNLDGAGSLPVPMELIPLLSGLAGLGLAIVFGYMATKQRATAFAMITLAIGELMLAASMMFQHFFGGEGGINANRMVNRSLFGFKYAQGIQVYYLILAWTLLAALAMLFLTRTPLGRMANASRDNFERVQFVGYDPRMVRFFQFALSGFFAGIGGGLYAITYEIVTFDALAAPLSANALLMAYIGGSASFGGPILGAVLITLLQSGVSLLSNSWLVYVGVLFITMVIFAPTGIMGLIAAHGPIARAGRLGRLAVPYLRVIVPGILMVLGFVGLVELLSFLTIGAAQGKSLVLFGSKIDIHATLPWLVATLSLLVGIFWLRREAQSFRRVWDGLMLELKPQRSIA